MVGYKQVDKSLFGSILPGGDTLQTKNKQNLAAECRANGGKWDGSKCIMPTQETQPVKETSQEFKARADAEKKAASNQVYKDEKGNISGFSKNGQNLIGLKPQEVESILSKQQAKETGGQSTQAFSQQAEAQQTALRNQEALSNLGLTPEQIATIQAQVGEAPIDWGQAITAGLAGVAPSAVGGAIGGAVVGGGVGSIPASVVGGLGGAVVGFLNGIRSNIKSQQSGEIASTKKVLSSAKTNMRQLAILASKDPGNAAEYVELYNQQLANVYTAQAKLKRETSGNLNSFMNDGTQDLVEFELFLQPGELATIYEQRLAMALMGGAPMEFTAEDLAMYEGEQ